MYVGTEATERVKDNRKPGFKAIRYCCDDSATVSREKSFPASRFFSNIHARCRVKVALRHTYIALRMCSTYMTVGPSTNLSPRL